jgi:hypothetical protein
MFVPAVPLPAVPFPPDVPDPAPPVVLDESSPPHAASKTDTTSAPRCDFFMWMNPFSRMTS